MKISRNVLTAGLVVGVCVLCVAAPAYALDAGLETNLDTLIKWIARVIGGAVFTLGIVLIGIKMAAGDQQALKTGWPVVVGGIIIFSSSFFVTLIKNMFD